MRSPAYTRQRLDDGIELINNMLWIFLSDTRQRLDDGIELIDNMLWIFLSGPVHLVIPALVEWRAKRSKQRTRQGFIKRNNPPILNLLPRKSFYWPNHSISKKLKPLNIFNPCIKVQFQHFLFVF